MPAVLDQRASVDSYIRGKYIHSCDRGICGSHERSATFQSPERLRYIAPAPVPIESK